MRVDMPEKVLERMTTREGTTLVIKPRKERKPDERDPPVEPYDCYDATTESSMSDTSQAAGVTRHSSISDYRP
jgi:hypothetical protein